jgi:hypothetical protein
MGKTDKILDTRLLPESPASVTARVVSDRGFHLLFTLRDTSGTELLRKFDEFEKAVLAKGWTPEQEHKKAFAPKLAADSMSGTTSSTVAAVKTTCAKCGADALRKSGLRKDKTQWEGVFCSTGDDTHKMWIS